MTFFVNRFLLPGAVTSGVLLDPSRRCENPRTNGQKPASLAKNFFWAGRELCGRGLTTIDPRTSTTASATIHPGKSWPTGDEPTIEFQIACGLEPQPWKS